MQVMFLGIFLFLSSYQANAFSLTDHERMTKIAIEEFSKCFPDRIREKDLKILIHANLAEDYNLLGKIFAYSHYFNPYKKVESWFNKNSIYKVRILDHKLSEFELAKDGTREDYLERLGSMLHFVQDVASPAHVVPVSHGLYEGFESYEDSGDITDAPKTEFCARSSTWPKILGPGELVLIELALSTLDRVRNEKFDAKLVSGPAINGDSQHLSWKDIWTEVDEADFGHFGILGDSFGKTKLGSGDSTYEVSSDVYNRFKKSQMRAAIEATKYLLKHYIGAEFYLALPKSNEPYSRYKRRVS